MSQPHRTALFGVTPLALLLGRACCLDDRPPVGLYDPDPEAALRGALFLGISARKKPDQLDAPGAHVQVAIVGHSGAATALSYLRGDHLALLLYEDPGSGPERCQAVALENTDDETLAISASIPPLTFKLAGSEQAKREGRAFLQSLSPGFQFTQA